MHMSRRLPTTWAFDPQRAVNLLTGGETANFRFEPEINLYLLMIWAIMPGVEDEGRRRGAARRLAGIITFSSITEETETINERRRLRDIKAIEGRLRTGWYRAFYASFLRPLGGLPSILSAMSLGSWNRKVQKELERLHLSLDLIDCAVGLRQLGTDLATRANAVKCLRENIYDVIDNYGVRHGEKRTGPFVSVNKIEKDWDNAPRTIVLLYALIGHIRAIWEPDARKPLMEELQMAVRNPPSIRQALSVYETIMRQFDQLANDVEAFRRWRVITVAGAPTVPLPQFDDARRTRVLAILRPEAQVSNTSVPTVTVSG